MELANHTGETIPAGTVVYWAGGEKPSREHVAAVTHVFDGVAFAGWAIPNECADTVLFEESDCDDTLLE